ncbi:J domain-containing protein [Imhoffiella purpurea]|uniref:Heat shock protein DnaJ domain protein n=1 Tax=Imhoffiella purpurea TaxID=1249627 RepID=W9V828_9GAMM|nr:J domain-containing protein [Imhoffiella purpurea]EXJ15733.1 heat shock protein DnaJ domain protein [Imhoffiella purpurea]
MRDPYLVLGVADDADDAQIERAYRQGIKTYPPERDPERFQALRAAYEALRTRRARLAHRLFDSSEPEPIDILDRAAPLGTPQRPSADLIAALLRGEDG